MSGALLASMVVGKGAQVTGQTLSDFAMVPDDASVGVQFTNAGDQQKYEGDGVPYSTVAAWLLLGAAADYEIRCTVNSGTTPAGSATGSWLSLSSTRAWTLTETGTGTKSCNLTIEIRKAGSSSSVDSATVTMSVEAGL